MKVFGRYVFISPQGNVFGVDNDGKYQIVANYFHEQDEVVLIDKIKGVFNATRNSLRGK
jgi:hypothetical protein